MEGMEAPNSASLGTMGSLLGKLDELLQAEDDGARSIRQLQDDVGSIRTKLVKLSEVHDPPLTVKYWMKDVRELSYDMEDCVDQFIHADGADAKFAWMEEISGFKARVDEVRERYDRYELESVLSRPTITNSLVSHHLRTVYGELEPVVPVGMDGPSSELLGWLKPNGDDGEEQLKVVSILGVNGVGKSTLAQKLWCELGGEFECRAFVQTAKKPDMRMILRSILSQVCPHQPPEACQVQNLIHDLKKHLQDKRYFIIIDDLWAVSVWDVVSRSFPEGNRCSRILTTTMIEDVALACCNYDPEHILKLEPLGANHSKQLFFSRVFGSGKGFPQQFYDFSDEITRKCGGLPLAIICIATLLSSHQETVQQWEFVQNFLFHSLKTNSTYAEILTQGLKLCYSNLPHCLKTCLLYLSVYPENYIILKEDLVNQWIAEGFICTMEGKDTVEVARSYFDELVSLGLIQQMNINCNKKGLSYAVHPIVFDYITCNSIEDNFITIIDYCQSTVLPNDKIRRLSLHFGSATYATTPSGIGLWQVRSLTFVGLLKCMPSMVEFKLLRVVTLHLWGDNGDASLPLTGICALFLLRYLQVRCNVTVELPDQMLGLKHLETLEINAKVSAVPSDIVHLPSLLHVILGGKRNHKHLTLGPVASGKAVSLDDSGSSTSSPLVFLQRFELLPPICIFPRLPEWIRRLRELRILEVVVRELRRGDLDVLAELPALTTLSLHVRTPTAVRIGRGAFPALECFKFLCGVLFLGFQEEAMPKLRRLKIGFNAYKGEKYDHMLADIEHLLNLQEIVARIGADTGAEESDRRAAESAFKDAIRMHPCHRSLKVKRVDRIDEGYDPSEEQNWSQQIESSNEQGVVLEIHLATQNEHLSIQQLEIMRKMPAQYMKKHADIGISRFYYLPEAHPSTRQKSGVAPIQLTFQLLEDITNRFSEEHKIGSGCYGETYKGVLPNGEEIAVKKLYHSQGLDNVQFGKEFKNLVRVQHPNVIRLVGYCETRRKHVEIDGEYGLGRIEERVLCFEYLQLGSLDKYLSDESSGLDWHTRYKIIKGTCEGLNYLHNGSKDPIYHLDLKPSNILLDENMVPKITDFSLSRLFSTTQTNTTKNIIGKLEYMPPEYIKKCQISTKFDVFSLGVTIIQIMAGPLGYSKCAEMSPQQFIELVHQNWRKRLQHKLQEADNLEVNTCIRLALKCVEDDQVKRPTIAEVLNKLNLIETVKTSLINQNTLEMEFVTAYGEATQYQIQEVIAKGSFGVVAAAVDTRTGDRVAIKKINYVFEHVSDATRTLREIKFLRLLRHPDIVEIKHIMLPPSRREFQDIYVVFELMDSDLHQVIKANDDLTPEHHQFFMYQLLRALKYIHAANVFHRDIKPKNILANANCKLKICDFGLARVPFNDAPSAIFWTDYVATRWYRAPELCGSFFSKYTTAIDIWSVGCIFAELLTGKPLFPGKNVVHQLDLITDLLGTPSYETLSQIRNEKARRYLRSMRKKHPVPFTQKFRNADPLALRLLERLLAFDPKDRPTAEEALADPYFACLSNVEREPSRHPISKLEFEFERKRLTKDDLRELIYREILEYHPQQLQEYVKGAEQISFLYPSGVDDVKRQFAHLEEHYSKGERGYPLQRKHASLPRERVLVSKDGNNEQRTDGEQRSADSIARTFVSPRRSQDMVNRRVKIMLRPSVGQKVVRSTNLSSQTYLKSASISASKFVVGDGNIYPEELRMVKSLRKCKERLTRSPCRDGPDLLRALCLN